MTEIDRKLGVITEGDDFTQNLTIKDSDGAVDISGWTVFVTVKSDIDDSDTDAEITVDVTTHDDAANGETSFTFQSSDTKGLDGLYEYDIQVKKSNGDIKTLQMGSVEFVKGVTDRTS